MGYPRRLPFKEAIAHLRPGQIDWRVFDQDEIWIDRHATVHRLSQMSTEHLQRVQDFILDQVAERWLLYLADREARPPLEILYRGRPAVDEAARQWAQTTPLWRGIASELARRGVP